MENKSIVVAKSFKLAVRIVKLYKHLIDAKKEFVLTKQMLRSGTSIGANIREAHNAESDADFIHKLGVAQKECDETLYWLELLRETDFLTQIEFESMSQDCIEVLKLLKSIIVTMKKKRAANK